MYSALSGLKATCRVKWRGLGGEISRAVAVRCESATRRRGDAEHAQFVSADAAKPAHMSSGGSYAYVTGRGGSQVPEAAAYLNSVRDEAQRTFRRAVAPDGHRIRLDLLTN